MSRPLDLQTSLTFLTRCCAGIRAREDRVLHWGVVICQASQPRAQRCPQRRHRGPHGARSAGQRAEQRCGLRPDLSPRLLVRPRLTRRGSISHLGSTVGCVWLLLAFVKPKRLFRRTSPRQAADLGRAAACHHAGAETLCPRNAGAFRERSQDHSAPRHLIQQHAQTLPQSAPGHTALASHPPACNMTASVHAQEPGVPGRPLRALQANTPQALQVNFCWQVPLRGHPQGQMWSCDPAGGGGQADRGPHPRASRPRHAHRGAPLHTAACMQKAAQRLDAQ